MLNKVLTALRSTRHLVLWSAAPDIRCEVVMRLVQLLGTAAFAACASLMAGATHAQTLDKVSFGTNWLAEAEHGGHYQALVDGTYRRFGLDVTIVPGGPQVNNRILLPVGKL